MEKKQAVVLLSGGLDSTTALAHAVDEGYVCHALTFLYGQKHQCEIEASKRSADAFGIRDRHRLIRIDPQLFRGSSLTGTGDVPSGREDRRQEDIPTTYVPARNTVFLSMALAYAEQTVACDIFIGVNAVDYSGYPDCRPEFIEAFERLANLGTKAGVSGNLFTIHAPLIRLTKVQIIQKGHRLGVDYSLTWSCYNPVDGDKACGLCESCRIRRKAFQDAGLIDPIAYA